MKNKQIAIIVIIIGLCIGIAWIIFSNVYSKDNVSQGVDFNANIKDVYNTLSQEEKENLIEMKNEMTSNSSEGGMFTNNYDRLPNAIKDTINPPSLKNGIEDLLYK